MTENKQQTILVSVLHNNQAMGFLANDWFEILANQPNLKLVILCPPEKHEFYLKHYARPGVVFEPIKYVKQTFLDSFFEYLLYSMINTKAVHYRQKYVLYHQGGWLNYLVKRFLCLVWGRFSLIRRFVRYLDNKLVKDNSLDELFRRYQPELVIIQDILFPPNSIRVLRAAKKFKIFSVGVVRSWDNLTSKGAVRVIPDKVIVQNEIMKAEAIKLADVKLENIFISGVQVFDMYHNFKPTPREEFYKKVGADPNKRLLLFAPYFGFYSDSVAEIIAIMDQGIKDGLLPADVQLLVRFPPVRPGENLKRLKSENVVYYAPGTPFYLENKLEFEFTREDIQLLADSMYYCPVTINFASTMTIDAAAFDAPIINIAFDGYKKRHFKNSVRCIYNYDHYQPVLKSGGLRLVHSQAELFEWLNRYLEDRSIDRAGRQKIIEIFCGQLDGQAGQRLANYTLKQFK